MRQPSGCSWRGASRTSPSLSWPGRPSSRGPASTSSKQALLGAVVSEAVEEFNGRLSDELALHDDRPPAELVAATVHAEVDKLVTAQILISERNFYDLARQDALARHTTPWRPGWGLPRWHLLGAFRCR